MNSGNPGFLAAKGGATISILNVYAQYFSKKGYRVDTAADGVKGLRKLRETSPSSFIMDQELPRGKGGVALVGISAPVSPDLSKPPVISFLLKPFSLSILADVLFVVLNANRSLSPDKFPFREERKC